MSYAELPRASIPQNEPFSAFLFECFEIFERASHQELQVRHEDGMPDPAESKPGGVSEAKAVPVFIATRLSLR